MLARIHAIGPLRALIYSKQLVPRRFALVPVGALPPKAQVGDVVEITPERLAQAPVVAPRKAPQGIRCSY